MDDPRFPTSFELVLLQGDAGMWTIVEVVHRPVMRISDKAAATRLLNAMRGDGRLLAVSAMIMTGGDLLRQKLDRRGNASGE